MNKKGNNYFLKVAYEYIHDTNIYSGICINLKKGHKFFQKFFKPTLEERDEYNHQPFFWMEEVGKSVEVNTNTRITALLFAAELWEDEKNHKYVRK